MTRHPRADAQSGKKDLLGPQGGSTTVTENRVRKTLFLDKETAEAIRHAARRTRQPEAVVIRKILNEHFGISFDKGSSSDP